MEFSLTTLGTASAVPVNNRFSSAQVMNVRGRLFLIDCAEGTQILLARHGISHAKIENILISHLHGDHVFGIMPLLSTMALKGRTAPLYIYAPEAFCHTLKFFRTYFADGVKFDINFIPLKATAPQEIIATRSCKVYAFPLNHKVETYGFLFREEEPALNVHKEYIEQDALTLQEIGTLKAGNDVVREDGSVLEAAKYAYKPYAPRSAAYCSDTAPFPEMAEWVRGVDLLYHEATFGNDMQDLSSEYFHSTAEDAARTAVAAGARKLVIGHFSSRYPDINVLLEEARQVFPETYLAEEGMIFDVPVKKLF
ncbi:MAG: ribonuclease Z [Bacteroidales bacterium]|nr:ribonuclease Z [Bacteroidales bacterium]MBO7488029.1 ribonuclease Z [Bacteroidales bacterium]